MDSVNGTRRCLVVLGVHRSGTSAVTRVLNFLGAELPKHLMAGGPSNEKGHWEPEPLVNLHEKLLAEAGTHWADIARFPATFPPERIAHYEAEIIRLLGEEFGNASLFVVKDPRICRLMPLWRDVLNQMNAQVRFVIPLRNPMEVALSLEKRNGLSLAHGCLLWLRNLLDAEYSTRGQQRIFLHYHDLLNDPVRTVRNVMPQFNDDWFTMTTEAQRKIESFMDIAQSHHFAKLDDLRYPMVAYQLLRETYEACTALVYDPGNEKVNHRLDGVRAEFEAAVTTLGVFLSTQGMGKEEERKIAAIHQMIAAHELAQKDWDEKLAKLSQRVKDQDEQIARLMHAEHGDAAENGVTSRLGRELTDD